MKHLIILFLMLMLCPIGALGETQEAFEMSCTYRTAADTFVYMLLPSGEERLMDTLPAGTYVRVNDSSGGSWKNLTYMKSGVTMEGWAAVELIRCTATVQLPDGTLQQVHELDPLYQEKLRRGDVLYDVHNLFTSLAATPSDLPDSPTAQRTGMLLTPATVYLTADVSSKALARWGAGTRFVILEQQDGWYKVEAADVIGYICAPKIKK